MIVSPTPHLDLFRLIIAKGSRSFERKLAWGALPRSSYAYCMYAGAELGKALGLSRVSTIEFGVFKGESLLLMQQYAKDIERIVGIGIDVYGFDTGAGLPPHGLPRSPFHVCGR
jgi:hypothetical protein